MYNVKILGIFDGWFINSEGQKYATHQLLTASETDRGVRYELQKCTADISKDYGKATFPFFAALFYDRYGRICQLNLD